MVNIQHRKGCPLMNRLNRIKKMKRIIIKVGTSTITHANGLLNLNQMESVVRQIADLHSQGYEVILVSSGSIGAGIGKLGLKTRPKTIPKKQVAAAAGQVYWSLTKGLRKPLSSEKKALCPAVLSR